MYYDEDMLEVGADGFGSERQGSRLLEDYGHNVIANVPLPQQLAQGRRNTKERKTARDKDRETKRQRERERERERMETPKEETQLLLL